MRDSSTARFERFTTVAFFNTILAIAWTVPVLLAGEFGLPNYNIAKTIAGGSVGTWASVLLAWAGYVGGSLLLTNGPSAATFATIHENIGGYVGPIMAFVFIGIIGALAWTDQPSNDRAPPRLMMSK